jgi:hypothetical protein
LNIFNLVRQDVMCWFGRRTITESEWLLHEAWLDKVIPGVDITPVKLFALFELVYVALYGISIMYQSGVIVFACLPGNVNDPDLKFRRWSCVAHLTGDMFPSLQTFSAMRTLQYCKPGIIAKSFQNVLLLHKEWSGKKKMWFRRVTLIPRFVILHLLFLIFGFQAFLVKFRLASRALADLDHQAHGLMQVALFLNQMLGIVSLKLYTKERIFAFIFGGVDNFICDSEAYRMEVWKAAFQRQVWRASGCRILPYLSVALTFNDVDFQRIVLDE